MKHYISNILPPLLITRLKQKKKLLKQGNSEHKKIKTALIIGGGGMRGSYSAGIVSGFKHLGMEDVFDVVVGVSAGAFSASYFLSKQGDIAPALFYEYLAEREFINYYRINQILNLNYAHEVLSQLQPLHTEVIKNSRSKLYIGATNAQNGKGEYIDAKDNSIDIRKAIYASSAVPFLNRVSVKINKKQYFDGVIGCGLPIEPAFSHGCTDILVVCNDPLGGLRLLAALPFKNTFFKIFRYEITAEMKIAISQMKKKYNETFDKILQEKAKGKPVGILAPDYINIPVFSINKQKLKNVSDLAMQQVISAFES